MPDRDEIEKLAKRIRDKHFCDKPWIPWESVGDQVKVGWRRSAEDILANFVPRTEHEELKKYTDALEKRMLVDQEKLATYEAMDL